MTPLVIPTDAPLIPGSGQGKWTYEDWEALPYDGNFYEVINGVLYQWSEIPSIFHQWIVQHLCYYLDKQEGLAYTIHQVGVVMAGCQPVIPDVSVVLAEHASIIHDRRIWGVPDLIVEVLSPGNSKYDLRVKLPAYAQAGVPEVGIINPSERKLSLYELEVPGRYMGEQVFIESDTMTFACLPTLPIQIAKLFEGAPDTTL